MESIYNKHGATIYHGDCLTVMREMPSDSIDSVVTDPPSGINFMGKAWDSNKGGRDRWIDWMCERASECLRLLKPGGHALVWSLPRTSHWTATAWEDAGFEPRDRIVYCFGSGFPKSLDVSKAIDKAAGAEREIVGFSLGKGGENLNMLSRPGANDAASAKGCGAYGQGAKQLTIQIPVTTPATDDAKLWDGWGTALKPAVEDWWLFRKPFSGTVVANILKYGTGAINIDGCRIPISDTDDPRLGGKGTWSTKNAAKNVYQGGYAGERVGSSERGRFPANIIHDGSEEVLSMFPLSAGQQGDVKGTEPSHTGDENTVCYGQFNRVPAPKRDEPLASAARFFYTAKADSAERRGSKHPTVKPLDLMRYLVRMITPQHAITLDPFMGSGTTLEAAVAESCQCIGIDQELEYCHDAIKRLNQTRFFFSS